MYDEYKEDNPEAPKGDESVIKNWGRRSIDW